jgi:Na+/melibiose symporter-like transporter
MSVTASITPALDDAQPRPLAFSAKILYGIGEMPITVLMVLSGLFILFFYNSVMGLPPSLVGAGLFATLALDAITDPLIGHLSDRTRSRLGRRHAFMLPGAIGMGPCFYLLFSPPRHLGHTGLVLWLIGSMVALRATSAIYRIPYLGLGAELSRDYDDRTRTMAVRALFGLVGTLAAAGLSFLLFFPATADGSEPRLRYDGYPHLGLAFGALMTVSGLVCFFGTLKHRTSGAAPTSGSPSFFSAFRISMQNTEFRKIWASSTIFFLAVVLNASMAIQYFTWYARIGSSASMSGPGPPHREAHALDDRHGGHGRIAADGLAGDRRRPPLRHGPHHAADRRQHHRRDVRQRRLGHTAVHGRRRRRYRRIENRSAPRRHLLRHR